MPVFGARDHKGIILDPDAGQPARSASGRQFTLSQVMKAVAVIAVILAIAVQRPDLLLGPVPCILVFLAACLYGLSKLLPRVRLTVVLVTAGLLLIYSAWVWRPPFHVDQALRAEELGRLCSVLAEKTDDNRSKERFLHESTGYGRLASLLRIQAMWYGLIRSVTKENPVALNERELILELDLLDSMERHERIAVQMGISYRRPSRRTGY